MRAEDEIIVLAEDETTCFPSLEGEYMFESLAPKVDSAPGSPCQGSDDRAQSDGEHSSKLMGITGVTNASKTASNWVKSMRARLLKKQQVVASGDGSHSNQGGATFGGRFLFVGWRQDIVSRIMMEPHQESYIACVTSLFCLYDLQYMPWKCRSSSGLVCRA